MSSSFMVRCFVVVLSIVPTQAVLATRFRPVSRGRPILMPYGEREPMPDGQVRHREGLCKDAGCSKTRQFRMRQQPATYVHLAVLGTAGARRDALVGIEESRRIEGAFDRVERVALFRRKLHAHRIDLLDADAMLARHRAAQFNTCFENVAA